MRYEFRQGVKCAHDNVKGKPSEQQPAGPVLTSEQEAPADDGEYANEGDQHNPMIERPVPKVIDEAH